jgi:uncharacterized protein DUF6064
MSEWWTYRLTSFLLFSPRTYYRTIELYNIAIWPAPLAGIAVGIAIVALLLWKHGRSDRIIATLLAICWLWTGWAFHYERYAQINWVASWIGAAFALEAALLVAVGVVAGKLAFERARGTTLWIAIALIAIVVAGYPLLAAITGRAWTSAEVFGTAPDPTALVTVAVLSLARGRVKWLLLAIPLLWCAATALTLRALMAPEFSVVIVAALCALAPAFRLSGRARGTT